MSGCSRVVKMGVFLILISATSWIFSACGNSHKSSTSSGASPLCPMSNPVTISMAAGSSLDFTSGAMPCSSTGACLQLNTSSTTGTGVGTDFLRSGEVTGLELLSSCSEIPSSGYTDTVAAAAGATYIAKINTSNTNSRYALFFVQQLATSGVGSPQSPAQIEYVYPYGSSESCPAHGTLASYTSAGTFTFPVPACVSTIDVELVGAGGGGGAGYINYTSSTSYTAGGGGGGGGAGATVSGSITVSSGASCSVTVGGAGLGSYTLGTPGTAGATSSVQCSNTTFSAAGGQGGVAGTATAGGAGGAGGGYSQSGANGGAPSGNTEGPSGAGGGSGVGAGGNGGGPLSGNGVSASDGQNGEVIISW